MDDLPDIRRIRFELKRRELTVARVLRLTPHMIRITLTGDDLADFASAGADDHVKIAVPGADGEVERRDYTPRKFDTERRELVIDFVDHPGGPATEWARRAQPGDRITVGGPRGSQVIGGPIDRWVLVGDETALPAIGRRIEELAEGVLVTSIVAVPGVADQQVFQTHARHDERWVHRPLTQANDPAPLLGAVRKIELGPRTFIWIAAEAGVARALRDDLLARGHPKYWLKAAGYWISGQADAAIKAFDEG